MGDREAAYWQAIAELVAALTALLLWATEATLRGVPDGQVANQLVIGITYARDAALQARDGASPFPPADSAGCPATPAGVSPGSRTLPALRSRNS